MKGNQNSSQLDYFMSVSEKVEEQRSENKKYVAETKGSIFKKLNEHRSARKNN